MRSQGFGTQTAIFLAAIALAVAIVLPSTAWAQGLGAAGVVVDAQGVLEVKRFDDFGGRLTKERITAARQSLAPEVTRFSKLRKISLNRLEEAIRAGQNVATEEMRYLAGLQRVRYVFLYPESKDIVLAGPAEGWVTDPAGRVVGMTSGRPVVQLQDLIVALRAFPPEGDSTPLIGCSIDPTQEGLAKMQTFLQSVGLRATPGDTRFIVEGLRDSLGLQLVSVKGVSPKTHFAQVMVEADYRMKLIGIGLERPPVRLVSYVDRANPSAVSRNAMQRWFFTPDYNCVRMSADGLAMELVGDGVKLVGENELVNSEGQRTTASRVDTASRAFVNSFTKKYSELAERSPVYAELRNLIDLAVAAAYIQQEDYYVKSDWSLGLFGDESVFPVEIYNAPRHVASAVNAIWKGRRLVTPIGGGVSVQAQRALDRENLIQDEDQRIGELRKQTEVTLAEGQWWWD